ncbi:MAG: DUF3810 domain-containing protein [Clostridia bacterium]|nr:DUF3810 domain-containing protein [Clostridia bacterium]
MVKVKGFIKKYIPVFTLVSVVLALLSLTFTLIARSSYAFADFINSTVSEAYRFVMAKITGIFPFSLFEVLMYLIVPLVVFLIVIAFKVFRTDVARIRYAFTLFGVVLLIYTAYAFALSMPYSVTPLDERLELSDTEVNEDNLYETAKLLLDEANALAEELEFDETGSAVMPYSLDDLSRKISEGYAALSEKYDFIGGYSSRVKPIMTEGAMSSLRLLGIYTYYTGEANLNIHYPDFNLPFTTAHEFAHQRGIARENEANFVAFLVCLETDDAFIRYSGYLRLYEYVANSLYRTNKDRYRELIADMSDAVRGELVFDSEVSKKYANSFIGELSHNVNDLFLKMNGTEGVVSYGLVTRLAVAYYAEG